MSNIYKVNRDNVNRPCFTDEQVKCITDLYVNQSMSLKKIGELFNIHYITLSKYMKTWGVNVSVRKNHFDEHYFDHIDTPNKAYILGLLYADGNNNYSANEVRMSLQERDRQILEKIKSEIGSSKELYFEDASKRKNFKYQTLQNQYTLRLSSKYLCEKLNEIGMTPNKSNTLQYPNCIPQDFQKDFIRGYLDGDGSIMSLNVKNRKDPQNKVAFVGTKWFLHSMREIIINELGIGKGQVYHVDSNKERDITAKYFIGGRKQVKAFLDWIYDGAQLFLERKHNKYLSMYYS